MSKLLKGKVTVVAGTSDFVIASVVPTLLQEDAVVIVPAKSADQINILRERVANIGTGRLVTLLTDYLDYDNAFDVAEYITQGVGRIDLFVVCFDAPDTPSGITETNILDWDKMIDQNITSFFIAARVALNTMKQNKCGMFISVANSNVVENRPGYALSNLSSTMQSEMAKHFWEDVIGYNIRYYHLNINGFKSIYKNNEGTTKNKWIADNTIGTFISQLFIGHNEHPENLFQHLTVSG
jgi:NADP-dependent 3-hydroxy acid dehydrogenase YdfG